MVKSELFKKPVMPYPPWYCPGVLETGSIGVSDHWNCYCCFGHHWYSTSSKSDQLTFVHCYSGSGDIYGHGVFSQLFAQQRVR